MIHKTFILVVFGALLVAYSHAAESTPAKPEATPAPAPAEAAVAVPAEKEASDSGAEGGESNGGASDGGSEGGESTDSGSFDINYSLVTAVVVALAGAR
uniref:Uncharacterized protein n=1 Tax=Caenorhabditis japonica TaxID=281687 RepID=A0A8R1EBU8_CAEJA